MQSYIVTDLQSKKGYHKLVIWYKCKDLVKEIYLVTEKFPRSELFGLSSQVRRAMVSVALNIVEGSRRNSKKEFVHFLHIADGSLTEVEACLEISSDLGFINQEDFQRIELLRQEVAIMLSAFLKSIQKSL